MEPEPLFTQSEALQCWFSLSYASFLVMPRVLMFAMPLEWQNKMAALLNEYDDTFTEWPDDMGSTVRVTKNNKIVRTPEWLLNYRHPDETEVNKLRRR